VAGKGLDFAAALEKLATNVKAAIDGVKGDINAQDSRIKALEQYNSRLDGAAKKRLTTERAKQMKEEGES
jgi:hypothetical protein